MDVAMPLGVDALDNTIYLANLYIMALNKL